MHARVTIAQGDPAQNDRLAQRINEEVVPAAKALPGMITGYWLADRSKGRVMGIVLFDSQEHLRESADAAAKMRTEATREMDVTFKVEEYEVIAQT